MNALAPITNLTEKLKLRAEDFELLEGHGAFEPYSKAELIDGDVYVVNAQYARHGLIKSRLFYALKKRLEEICSDLEVYSEVSLRVTADSMPEPDLFLAPQQGFGPVPVAGVVLIVEVSDTTLATDLGRKAVLYAAAGVREYWVVDVNEQRIVTHRMPGGDGYADKADLSFGEPLVSATIAGLHVDSSALQY